MAGDPLKRDLGKLLDDLKAQGLSDEEIRERWQKEFAKRFRELDDKELEERSRKSEESEIPDRKPQAYWEGYLDGSESMRKWILEYPNYKKPEPPEQEPLGLDDEDEEEEEEEERSEGSWKELWQEIYRCQKEEEDEELEGLPSSFGELYWKMHWY
jgi:hypothetical protein